MLVDSKTILFLAANPRQTAPLRLDQEQRQISEGLRRSDSRDRYQLVSRWAVQVQDLRRALLEENPQILHFSGHGGEQGLVIEATSGQTQVISGEALAGLLQEFQIECVVLNACYSLAQAAAIQPYVGCVVGMEQAIGDRAALAFAVGFYDGLGAGRSYEQAYRFGRNAMQLEGLPQQQIPVFLMGRPGHRQVFISYREKDPDRALALEFSRILRDRGHQPFLAEEDIALGSDWPERIDRALSEADYFLLFLSESAATSEFVIEEVRRAKELRESRSGSKPVILPIRVKLRRDHPLNYDLRSYLSRIQHRQWESEADTAGLVAEILELIEQGGAEPEQEPAQVGSPLIESERPLPIAEPELPAGVIKVASRYYMERPPAEERCFQEIAKPGSLIRIKAPRQMGKTSLMSRILHQAKQLGHRTLPLSLQESDRNQRQDLDQLLLWMCEVVWEEFGISKSPDQVWNPRAGSKRNCTRYFSQTVLKEMADPLVLGLDELDLVFEFPQVATDFGGLLRFWNESAKTIPIWQKLKLVIVHSTEPYMITDIMQSPFANVGYAVELPDLTQAQVQDLVGRHGLRLGTTDLEQLWALVRGHPYLVRLMLYELVQGARGLDQLLAEAVTEAGIYGGHLRRLLWLLQQRPDLLRAMQRIVEAGGPVWLNLVERYQLESLGLIRLQGNEVVARYGLYRQYFRHQFRGG